MTLLGRHEPARTSTLPETRTKFSFARAYAANFIPFGVRAILWRFSLQLHVGPAQAPKIMLERKSAL